MSLVLIRKNAPTKAWLEALAVTCPDLKVHIWPETGPVEEVEFVLTWAADPGVIASFPNLKAILSLGAGVDHILNDPTVPLHLPVVRMIDPSLTRGMTQYLLMALLRLHRNLAEMEANQRQALWTRPEIIPRRVGVMGMGELGTGFATTAVSLGYDVAGWSRSRKDVEGVTSYAGEQDLAPFLARSDVLVCLLPRTTETEGVLNASLFERMPRGAHLINVARGEHLVEEDLLAALESGQLAGAVLDVFRKEPLPAEHPFWSHPRIFVTPHIASMTVPDTAAQIVADNIGRLRRGEPPLGLVDRDHGY
ncbi:glyoxylate/hydroxypyruvate reductase A [Agaricicola taiwanensis]|uniref:Glyoxylate/hydroxypyruvate reductase A n=1 Tax=Agaricicola taiwanensis TaxID=591372 RepID=A0A8J2VLY9_9RHOB|nr:glyoxylate/hydroxypyruvate reductase A [Agaricicola taiwanensis]GGE32212.1 glyoxylate/hydroxypyruvate reductase A [Agaricicola taiwanensis]